MMDPERLHIEAGQLRDSVRIERPPTTRDSAGEQPVTGWTTVINNLKCQIVPLSGRELALAKEMHAEVTHRVISWYVPGILPEMRIMFTDRENVEHNFNIIEARDILWRGKKLVIECREIVG